MYREGGGWYRGRMGKKEREVEDLVEQLREERRLRGLSQVQLSLKAGMARNYVYQIESGRHRPTLAALIRIAHVLGYRLVLTPKKEN